MLVVVALMRGDAEQLADFSFEFEDEVALELERNFSQIAVMSLLLTVANVVMVALGATLMFRLKEVLPVNKKVFWEDLKVRVCPTDCCTLPNAKDVERSRPSSFGRNDWFRSPGGCTRAVRLILSPARLSV